MGMIETPCDNRGHRCGSCKNLNQPNCGNVWIPASKEELMQRLTDGDLSVSDENDIRNILIKCDEDGITCFQFEKCIACEYYSHACEIKGFVGCEIVSYNPASREELKTRMSRFTPDMIKYDVLKSELESTYGTTDDVTTHGTDVNQFVSDSCVDHSCITCAYKDMVINGKPVACPGNWKPVSKEKLEELLQKKVLCQADVDEVLKALHELKKETKEDKDVETPLSTEQLDALKHFMREQIQEAFKEMTSYNPPPKQEEPKTPVDYGYIPEAYRSIQPTPTPQSPMYGFYPNMQRPVFYDGKSFSNDFGLGSRPTVENNKPIRPDKENYYLDIAEAVAKRGTCLRRKFGAIIVNNDGHIVSTGYVGAPRGRENCCDRGVCYRMENKIPSGERYEKCRSVHAEMNAIIQASSEEMRFSTLYLVGLENDGSYTNADCCSMCKRVIINSGITRVVARQSDGTYTETPVISWIVNDDSLDINHVGY